MRVFGRGELGDGEEVGEGEGMVVLVASCREIGWGTWTVSLLIIFCCFVPTYIGTVLSSTRRYLLLSTYLPTYFLTYPPHPKPRSRHEDVLRNPPIIHIQSPDQDM